MTRITNRTRDTTLAGEVAFARSPWARLVGLLARRSLPPGHALFLEPCGSVHTMFMRFTIDVVFVDKDWRVVKTVPALGPFRASLGGRNAHAAIELPPGTIDATNTTQGDQLAVET